MVDAGKSTIVPKMAQSKVGVFPIFGGVMVPSWDLDIPGVATYSRDNYENLTFNADECQAIIDYSKVELAR